MKELKVTGRILPISEATRRRNPELYKEPLPRMYVPKEGGGFDEKESLKLYNKPKKRIRQSAQPLMNKLETKWSFVLHQRFPDTLITANLTRFRLANGLWYKPDFIVWDRTGIICWEVKGPKAFRGGFENLKMAASKYPEFKWFLVWEQDGRWQEQQVLP